MATTLQYRELVGEICGPEGPTGDYAEVLEVAVVDYGGNEYGRARTARGVARITERLRIPTQLRAVKVGDKITPAEAMGAGRNVGLV
jgi:hypothetical protein